MADRPVLAERLIASPLGAITQGKWFDPLALYALRRALFPLARLSAAADAAGLSASRFFEQAGIASPSAALSRQILPLLVKAAAIRSAASEAEASWQASFFGSGSDGSLAAIEAKRLAAAHRATLSRVLFRPVLWRHRVAPMRWQIPTPVEVEAEWGGHLGAPETAYRLPDPLPAVERSASMREGNATVYWLRFASPGRGMGDMAYARVTEPDLPHPPSIVIGNGVCMEPENVDGFVDAGRIMCRMGFRAIELTSPWHGRRCRVGDYAGERFFATAPMGQIDLFTAQAQETGVLIDWCRRHFDAPVALSGISLGSFVAQLVASHGAHWPSLARPDAVLLITHTGSMAEVLSSSGLVAGIGIGAALERAGWNEAALRRWTALTDPAAVPALAPGRIVSVLGSADRVTPVRGGLDLVRRWGLPDENIFLRRQGHFGSAIGLVRDRAPLERLRAIVGSI